MDRSAIPVPDDRDHPAQLTLIRPLGTTGLPDSYVRPLKHDVELSLSADADLPDRFIAALQELIDEIQKSGSAQLRYELEKGVRGETAGDYILYHFPFTDESTLLEESQVKIQVDGRKISGTITSIGRSRLVLALKENLGDKVRHAAILIDEIDLLEALKDKIEAVKKGKITLNRTLADAVVRPGALPKRPDLPIRANDVSELNNNQRAAYENARREALTFIWGPPGCGKTKTLGAIVRSAFESNKRILICSNTNKAVDQVLYMICKEFTQGTSLPYQHPAMKEGRVVRLGRVVDDKLESEFREYVTVEGIVERRSANLNAKKQRLEAEIAQRNADTLSAKECLGKFDALDKARQHVTTEQENANNIAREGKALQKQLSHHAAHREKFAKELQRRRNAIFTFFRRSEEAIQSDIQRNAKEHQQIETSIIELKEQYRTARQRFQQAQKTRDDCRSDVAGEDRTTAQAIVSKAEKKLQNLAAKLGEVESKVAALHEAVLRDARIIGATCTKTYLSQKDLGTFDLVIIDETSMIILPAAWFSAGLARERVVIAGDFRQLPPIVKTEQEAIFQELGVDVFKATERDRPDAPGLTMLKTQYRMRPEICDLISGPMYEHELTTAPEYKPTSSRLPPGPFEQALTIIDTSDLWPFESRDAFRSRFNILHALLVRNFVWHFQQNGVIETKHDLGICTPYAAQARLIQKLLEGDSLDDFAHSGTVHRFQGDERRIMLLEIPESYGGYYLGPFVQGVTKEQDGTRLINVAVSRAKEHFVVLANLTYLDRHLPSLSLLRGILHEMQQKGCVVSGRELMELRPIERDLAGLIRQVPFDDVAEGMGIFDEKQFERGLRHDIQSARQSVVLFSGYVTPARVARLGELLRSKISEGIKVRCVTRPPKQNGSIPEADGRKAIEMLEKIGAVVDFRARIHEKICLIDHAIVWWGSLNALSHMGYADEMMTRAANNEFAQIVASHMSKWPISPAQAQESVAEKENPRCGNCGAHSVLKEGWDGAYFECSDKPSLPEEGSPCLKCGAKTVLRESSFSAFYGCVHYPDCKGTAEIQPATQASETCCSWSVKMEQAYRPDGKRTQARDLSGRSRN